MEIPDELLCVFNATVEEQDGSYHITVPEREIADGDVERGGVYRIALVGSEPRSTDGAKPEANSEPEPERTQHRPAPPVEEGDQRTVEIEDIGEQGDGIARVERGYVIIVPDTEKHDRVTIEITDVAANVAFAKVVERKPYYE